MKTFAIAGVLALLVSGCAGVQSIISSPSFDPGIQLGASLACKLLPAKDQAAAGPILASIVSAATSADPTNAVSIATANSTVGAIGLVWYAVTTVLNANVPTAAAYTNALPAALGAAANGCMQAFPIPVVGTVV